MMNPEPIATRGLRRGNFLVNSIQQHILSLFSPIPKLIIHTVKKKRSLLQTFIYTTNLTHRPYLADHALPPSRLPHHTLIRHNSHPSMRPHINRNLIHRPKPMLQIQRHRHRRCFQESPSARFINLVKTIANEQRT